MDHSKMLTTLWILIPIVVGVNCAMFLTSPLLPKGTSPVPGESCKCNPDTKPTIQPTKATLCNDELGVRYGGSVDDTQMIPSSVLQNNVNSFGAQNGRLNTPFTSGDQADQWSPYVNDKNQWLQVDLLTQHEVTGVEIQGSAASRQFVTSFKVRYSQTGNTFYTVQESGFDKLFVGNSDGYGVKQRMFPQPVQARFIRIAPQTWSQGIAMRIELLGCREKSVAPPTLLSLTKDKWCYYINTRYSPGQTITEYKDCMVKTCVVTNGQPQWSTDIITCQQPRSYCQVDETAMGPDDCCPKCISKCSYCSPKPVTNETLLTFSFTHPFKGLCTGKASGLNECSGYCSSTYNVGRPGDKAMSKCTCCKPSQYEKVSVMYNCEKMPHFKMMDSPKSCECSLCSDNTQP